MIYTAKTLNIRGIKLFATLKDCHTSIDIVNNVGGFSVNFISFKVIIYSHWGYIQRKEYAPYREHILFFNSSPF